MCTGFEVVRDEYASTHDVAKNEVSMDPQEVIEVIGNTQLTEAIAKMIEMDERITKLEGRMSAVELGLIRVQNMVNTAFYNMGFKPEAEKVREALELSEAADAEQARIMAESKRAAEEYTVVREVARTQPYPAGRPIAYQTPMNTVPNTVSNPAADTVPTIATPATVEDPVTPATVAADPVRRRVRHPDPITIETPETNPSADTPMSDLNAATLSFDDSPNSMNSTNTRGSFFSTISSLSSDSRATRGSLRNQPRFQANPAAEMAIKGRRAANKTQRSWISWLWSWLWSWLSCLCRILALLLVVPLLCSLVLLLCSLVVSLVFGQSWYYYKIYYKIVATLQLESLRENLNNLIFNE